MKKLTFILGAEICIGLYMFGGLLSGKWYNDFQKRINRNETFIKFIEPDITPDRADLQKLKSSLEKDIKLYEKYKNKGTYKIFSL